MKALKWWVGVLGFVLSGCASEAWRTPPCEGQFEPINAVIAPSTVHTKEHPHVQ